MKYTPLTDDEINRYANGTIIFPESHRLALIEQARRAGRLAEAAHAILKPPCESEKTLAQLEIDLAAALAAYMGEEAP